MEWVRHPDDDDGISAGERLKQDRLQKYVENGKIIMQEETLNKLNEEMVHNSNNDTEEPNRFKALLISSDEEHMIERDDSIVDDLENYEASEIEDIINNNVVLQPLKAPSKLQPIKTKATK